MPRRVLCADLASELAAAAQAFLVVDTCSLLDIHRAVPRHGAANVAAAVELAAMLEETPPRCFVIIPSVVEAEWARNLEAVQREARKFIENRNDTEHRLAEVLEKLGIVPNPMEVDPAIVALKLEDLCERILAKTLAIAAADSSRLRAFDRVSRLIKPARLGKDSTMDCLAFEEMLEVARTARGKGHVQPIAFVSSNTDEYRETDSKKIEAGIARELAEHRVVFCANLSHAIAVVKGAA